MSLVESGDIKKDMIFFFDMVEYLNEVFIDNKKKFHTNPNFFKKFLNYSSSKFPMHLIFVINLNL